MFSSNVYVWKTPINGKAWKGQQPLGLLRAADEAWSAGKNFSRLLEDFESSAELLFSFQWPMREELRIKQRPRCHFNQRLTLTTHWSFLEPCKCPFALLDPPLCEIASQPKVEKVTQDQDYFSDSLMKRERMKMLQADEATQRSATSLSNDAGSFYHELLEKAEVKPPYLHATTTWNSSPEGAWISVIKDGIAGHPTLNSRRPSDGCNP